MAYDSSSFPNFFASSDSSFASPSGTWFDIPTSGPATTTPNHDDIWSTLGVPNTPSNTANNPHPSNTLTQFQNATFNTGPPPASYFPPTSHSASGGQKDLAVNNDLQQFFASHNFPSLPFVFGDAGFTASPSAGLASPAPSSTYNTANPAAAFMNGIVPQSRLARSQSGSNISDSGGSPDSSSQSEAGLTPANANAHANKKDKEHTAAVNKTAALASAAAGGTSARARKTSTAKKVPGGKKSAAAAEKAEKEKEKEKARVAAEKEKEKEKDKVGEKRKEPTEGRATPLSVKDRRSSKSSKSGASVSGSVAPNAVDDEFSHTHPNEDSEDDEDDGSGSRVRTTDRRKEQNRNAQRAFRERKEKHMKELEDRVDLLENTTKEQSTENQNLRDLVERLRRENERLTVYETAFQFSFNREYVQPGNMPLSSSFQGNKNAGVAAAAAAAKKGSPAAGAGSESGSGSVSSGSPAPSLAGSARQPSSSASSPVGNAAESPSAARNAAYTQYRDVVDNMWAGKKGASATPTTTKDINGTGAGADGGKKFEVDINGLCAEMEAKASCQEAARKALEEALIQDQHLAHIFKNSK